MLMGIPVGAEFALNDFGERAGVKRSRLQEHG
jgi:hypothetical protein